MKPKQTERTFRSIEEVWRTYLPKKEKDIFAEEDPKKVGRHIAESILKDLRAALSVSNHS